MKKKRGKKRELSELDPWSRLPVYTVEDNDRLHKKHSGTSYSYVLDNYCAWFQHGKLSMLCKSQQERAFDRVQHFVHWKCKTHFKRAVQFNPEFQMERVLAYYEWARLHWHQNPPWIRFAFEKNFSGIEAVLQCRRLGIGLMHDSCLLNCKTKYIRYFIIYFILRRQDISFEQYYISQYKYQEVYDDIIAEAEVYLQLVRLSLEACSSAGLGHLQKPVLDDQGYQSLVDEDGA